MSKHRRLVVTDAVSPNGTDGYGHRHTQIDLTGIKHANSQIPMYAVVQEQCNLGCWHDVSHVELPYWGSD
jgi:hypothetical protein